MAKKKTLSLLAVASLLALAACAPGEAESGGGDVEASYPAYDEASICIHYSRPDGNYDSWALWLWADGAEGAEYAFNGVDSFGAVASYPLSTWGLTGADGEQLGFIVKSAGSWNAKDTDADRFVDFEALTPWEDDSYHIYLNSGDAAIYTTPDLVLADEISAAYFGSFTSITVQTSNPMSSAKLTISKDGTTTERDIEVESGATSLRIPYSERADFQTTYTISVTFEKTGATLTREISKQRLYSSRDFGTAYNYDGDDLGVHVLNGTTTFKVWSPVVKDIKVRVYDSGTPTSVDATRGSDVYTEYAMTLGEKGVWSASVNESLYGKYYTYVVTSSTYPEGREIVDPYAKGAGVNGLRGMIVDFSATNPDSWGEVAPIAYDRKELVVYETHVSDITSHGTWTGTAANRYKYAGLIEKGTTYASGSSTVKTGFDHIDELGVNAVQLLPIFDQANDETKNVFNWGYNPLNYNVVEGQYSSDPHDGYVRIREFKEVVKSFHEAGINIIMDVVYNHTNGLTGQNFDVLVPGYYYRYNADGTPSNGSGCGNETASELYMFRKFMVDSTEFWASEYKLGGFRFDLMGVHDVQTMNTLVSNLKENVNANIVVYGEPWTGGTIAYTGVNAIQNNVAQFQGYGQFNDGMRDALIKGGLSGPKDRGWVSANSSYDSSGDSRAIVMGIKGATYNQTVKTLDPDQTNNYVTCHDNYTLFDRFYHGVGGYDEATVARMSVVANSIVMTSQGTSFMLGGDELLRSKNGNSNSYDASYAVNAIDYSNKIEHGDVYESYKALIALKTGVDGLHLGQADAQLLEDPEVSDSLIVHEFDDKTNGRHYKIAVTNGIGSADSVDFAGYTLYLDSHFDSGLGLSATTAMGANRVVVAYR